MVTSRNWLLQQRLILWLVLHVFVHEIIHSNYFMKAYIKHEPNLSTLARVCRVESYFNHVYYQISCKTGTCTSNEVPAEFKSSKHKQNTW